MINTWICDIRHYLDESGGVPDELPGPALRLLLYFGSIAAWATRERSPEDRRTNVACRRSPGHRRCRGTIEAALTPGGEIVAWLCPICGDNGEIRGWEETWWDRRPL